jgi:hypothetical protein
LFDRPKPTAGCSAIGRRRSSEVPIEQAGRCGMERKSLTLLAVIQADNINLTASFAVSM